MQLITVAAFASAALAAPAAQSACTKAAQDLTFSIKDFTFDSQAIYSTPSHLATSEGHVDFDLAVSAKKQPIHCSADSVSTYPSYFDGQTWYDCEASDTFSAQFKYDLDTGLVKIKANWQCPDASFQASGKHVVEEEEDCDTETKTNKHWSLEHPGKFYQKITTTCADTLTTFKPSKISAVA